MTQSSPEKRKAYYQKNRDKILEEHKEYHKKNRERNNQRTRDWRATHLEESRVKVREYARTHKEQAKELHRKWSEKNAEELVIKRQLHYQENKEAIKNKEKKRYALNKDHVKIREKMRRFLPEVIESEIIRRLTPRRIENQKKNFKKRYIENRDDIRLKVKEYYQQNKNEIRKYKIRKFEELEPKPAKSFNAWKWQLESWSLAVRTRDGGICNRCRGTAAHAHHIKPKKTHPELSLDINNGESLCEECHWEEHRINGK